jgi:hypothetical protein
MRIIFFSIILFITSTFWAQNDVSFNNDKDFSIFIYDQLVAGDFEKLIKVVSISEMKTQILLEDSIDTKKRDYLLNVPDSLLRLVFESSFEILRNKLTEIGKLTDLSYTTIESDSIDSGLYEARVIMSHNDSLNFYFKMTYVMKQGRYYLIEPFDPFVVKINE